MNKTYEDKVETRKAILKEEQVKKSRANQGKKYRRKKDEFWVDRKGKPHESLVDLEHSEYNRCWFREMIVELLNDVPEFPIPSQSVEQGVKLSTKFSKRCYSWQEQLAFIVSTIKYRKMCPTFNLKRDYTIYIFSIKYILFYYINHLNTLWL